MWWRIAFGDWLRLMRLPASGHLLPLPARRHGDGRPIFKYGTKHFLICPVCRQGPSLDEARVRQLETAKLLLVRARMNELTEEQYTTELAAVQNPASVGLTGGAAEI